MTVISPLGQVKVIVVNQTRGDTATFEPWHSFISEFLEIDQSYSKAIENLRLAAKSYTLRQPMIGQTVWGRGVIESQVAWPHVEQTIPLLA